MQIKFNIKDNSKRFIKSLERSIYNETVLFAKALEKDIKADIPVKSGDLRNSFKVITDRRIDLDRGDNTLIMGSDLEYARFINRRDHFMPQEDELMRGYIKLLNKAAEKAGRTI